MSGGRRAALDEKGRESGAPQQEGGTEPDGASADHGHIERSFAINH
jgi:hypothetical protein